ncbi:fibropellin-3-like [Branchiostoma lanceolatum]|uniref:fibropellin-3-like n=1 Tax=Branchiostoma lanceolatum TaxID=7740 RepID=UPI0034521CD5
MEKKPLRLEPLTSPSDVPGGSVGGSEAGGITAAGSHTLPPLRLAPIGTEGRLLPVTRLSPVADYGAKGIPLADYNILPRSGGSRLGPTSTHTLSPIGQKNKPSLVEVSGSRSGWAGKSKLGPVKTGAGTGTTWKVKLTVAGSVGAVILAGALLAVFIIISRDECSWQLCQNNGTCTDHVNQFFCTCASGFNGTLCETDIDECSSNPCQSGGTCSDGVDGYNCTCLSGYAGSNCETDVDECAGSPCQNGGTCEEGISQFSCTCAYGFNGTLCDIDVDECTSSPCQNGGTCQDGINQFTCTCQAGYGGTVCGSDVNECDSGPCQNGGVCVDGVDLFTCNCADGYEGDLPG